MAIVRRLLIALAALCVLAFAAPAYAVVREIGVPTDSPFPDASCPDNCQAIGQVTGYQVEIGKARNPFAIHRPGTLVAFTIRLGKPNAQQTQFFTNLFGGTPQVRLAILKPVPKSHTNASVLQAQSEIFKLAPYLGSTPTFALAKPIKVQPGEIVAITVPTWAPAFAVGLEANQAWRSSRSKSSCNSQQSAAQQTLGGSRSYQCLFRTARLLYSVTYIPTPKPTTSTRKRQRHRG
jgi:hypothetical protein